jgi:serine/threonine protein kinase
MKQVCLQCGRISAGSDLFCQETYCPGEMSPTILDAGDWFGDIEIVKPIIVLRSAVLYEASHQKRRVYLKVAHPGAENKERLKREAEFLQSLQLRKLYQQTLPRLLPAYANTTVAVDAYGKTMLRGHLLYFFLFEHFEGEPLRDVLRRNPQLWISHVGWLMISLAATINYLHMHGRYHCGLSPDGLLVRFDEKPSVPRILLFDLGAITDKAHLNQDWHAFAVPPAYTAPELIDVAPGQLLADYRTDVYGLGMMLYELLVGQPAFSFRLRGDSEVLQAVTRGQRVTMNRIEDVRTTAQIALQATSLEPGERQKSAYEFAQQLRALFRDVPPPKRSPWPSLNTVFLAVVVLLIIVFLVVLALALSRVG